MGPRARRKLKRLFEKRVLLALLLIASLAGVAVAAVHFYGHLVVEVRPAAALLEPIYVDLGIVYSGEEVSATESYTLAIYDPDGRWVEFELVNVEELRAVLTNLSVAIDSDGDGAIDVTLAYDFPKDDRFLPKGEYVGTVWIHAFAADVAAPTAFDKEFLVIRILEA